MHDHLRQRRHRFDALAGLLTGLGAASRPATAHRPRGKAPRVATSAGSTVAPPARATGPSRLPPVRERET